MSAIQQIIAAMAGESTSLTPGTPAVFEFGNTSNTCTAIALSSTKCIAIYTDAGNQSRLTANVLDISGSTITPGSPQIVDTTVNTYGGGAVCMLSATKVVVAYAIGGSYYGTAVVLDISGTTITVNTKVTFESGGAGGISITTVTSTKALVGYRDADNSNYATACVLDISGSVITPGTPQVVEAIYPALTTVCTLSSSQVVFACVRANVDGTGRSYVLDISGTTITPSSAYVYETNSSANLSICAISSTKVLAAYTLSAGAVTACILSISGSSISPGTPSGLSYSADSLCITNLSAMQSVLAYGDSADSYKGKAAIITTSGSSASGGASYVFSTGITGLRHGGCAMISPTKSITVYTDQSNSSYGTACVLNK